MRAALHEQPRLVLGGWVALLFSCQEPPDHPPAIDTCAPGMVCFPGSAEQPNPGGDDGDDGEVGAGGAAPEAVRGSVRELVDDVFTGSIAFTGQATIAAEGEQRGVVEAEYTGVGLFELEGFEASDPLWLGAFPEADRGVLPTLSPVPLAAAFGEIELGVVREENLELVFQLSSTSAERTPGTAQLILFFTDATAARQSLSGVEASMSEAEFVSYANAGSWSDVETATDQTGVVVLTNIDAPAFPGSTRRVFLGGRAMGYITVRVAADVVTLVEVAVQ